MRRRIPEELKMRKRLLALFIACAVLALAASQRKLPKPGWNLFSKQQDVELGREYAQQVEQQMTVVPNKDLTDYVNRVGMRLVRQGQLDDYPYYFKVVQEDSINAFALPGGPMYIHTGLIKAAENEAQLAGVLAHELAHIVLRHGTHQATKSQFLQLGAILVGGAVSRGGGLAGALGQLGIGLGANSYLLSFSRGMESEADLLGSYTMAKAGYNPIELARFFEKLEAQGGNQNSLVARFLSDHPSPGNRIQAIEDQLPYMPRGPYNAQAGDLKQAQQVVAQLAPPIKKRGSSRELGGVVQPSAQQSAPATSTPVQMPRIELSGQFKTYQSGEFSFSYPKEWEVSKEGDQSVIVSGQTGRVGNAVGYGIMVFVVPAQDGRVELPKDTSGYLKGLIASSPNMKIDSEPSELILNGVPALLTCLSSDSPYQEQRETDNVLTFDLGAHMLVFVFVSPSAQFQALQQSFKTLTQSVRISR
jgi:Zn-dependent protease with chaperone function